MLNLISKNRPLYDFSAPLVPEEAAHDDPLFTDLVATDAFQRMKSIRFLGGIDYTLVHSPNGVESNRRFTRYQHSLGVARLALHYCNIRDISLTNRRLIYTAALLHDIGHAPLSHSLEPVFQEVFGISHHRATEDIITGRVPLGKDINETLRRYGVDIERVLALIAGADLDFDGFFGGPINFDTVDAILRSQIYARLYQNLPNPEAVIEAAIRRSNDSDRDIVDQFWSYKNFIYQHVINSRTGVMVDFACRMFMRRHLKEVKKYDYFSTEEIMFCKLPGLRQLLKSPTFESEVVRLVDGPIQYKERKFFINSSADFFDRDDKGRYQQSKRSAVLTSKCDDSIEVMEMERDLFNE